MTIGHEAKCPRCKGTGQMEDEGLIYSCPDCEGTGEDFHHEMTDDEMDEVFDRKSGKD